MRFFKAIILFFCLISFISCEIQTLNEEKSFSNEIVDSNEITIVPVQKILVSTYDHIELEIINKSDRMLWLDSSKYNIYEKTNTGYILIDSDNDGFTYDGKNNIKAIESKSTGRIRFYLGELINNGYARTGNYKIEILLSEGSTLTTYFEITNEVLIPKTGIFITCDTAYSINDDENFSYKIINNSKEDIQVTLSVTISRYKDGTWVRLPYSKEYNDIYHEASIWSENLSAGNERTQIFSLSLADMVGTELTPGKYRLEKQIAFNWYFAEFEVH